MGCGSAVYALISAFDLLGYRVWLFFSDGVHTYVLSHTIPYHTILSARVFFGSWSMPCHIHHGMCCSRSWVVHSDLDLDFSLVGLSRHLRTGFSQHHDQTMFYGYGASTSSLPRPSHTRHSEKGAYCCALGEEAQRSHTYGCSRTPSLPLEPTKVHLLSSSRSNPTQPSPSQHKAMPM
jgi:hypothetical protein